jgi:hypothetical protein
MPLDRRAPGTRRDAATRVGNASAGRHFVAVSGGGDTSYLFVGTTAMTVPAGSVVSFDPLRLSTNLAHQCAQWDLMARFGGRVGG